MRQAFFMMRQAAIAAPKPARSATGNVATSQCRTPESAVHQLPVEHAPNCRADKHQTVVQTSTKRQAAAAAQQAHAPESMLTTVTPGADELRAASRGATPPKAAP